jgi:hypothetical protein
MQISSQPPSVADINLVPMRPQNLPFVLLAAGVFAAVALTRRPGERLDPQPHLPENKGVSRRFVLARDVPSLELRRGEVLRVEPEALIHVGDVVALRSDEPEVVLARFHDELMHCVAGLVVREQRQPSGS